MIFSLRLRTLYIFFSGVLLTLIAGLRGGNDPDYVNYYDIYESSKHGDLSAINVEPFYFYFNKIFSLTGVPFVFVMLLMAVPAVLIKMYVIYRHSHYAFFSILIYILTIYISFDLIAVRQGVAIAFTMLATSFWFGNRYLAIILVFIGSLFHASALIVLPVFYFMSCKWRGQILTISILMIFGIEMFGINIDLVEIIRNVPFIPSFIIAKLEIYASYRQEGINSVKQIFVCVVAFLIYRRESENQFIKIACFLYIMGFLLSLLFSSIGDIAFRIKWYFFWGEMFFIPYILFVFSFQNNNRNLKPLTVVVFGLLVIVLYLYPAINFINDISSRGNSLIL